MVKILHHQGRSNSEQAFYSNRGRGRGRGGMLVAKDEVVVVATIVKASSNISQMMHKGQTHVDVETLEAGGVKEVAKISKEIMHGNDSKRMLELWRNMSLLE